MQSGNAPGAKPTATSSWKADVDVARFRAVVQKTGETGVCAYPSAKNDEAVGLTAFAQDADKIALVIEGGRYWAVLNSAGGAVAVGDKVIVADATGRLQKDDTGSGLVANIVGTVETPATNDNDEFIIKLELQQVQIA